MKVRASFKVAEEQVWFTGSPARGRIYVINKKNPRFKAPDRTAHRNSVRPVAGRHPRCLALRLQVLA